jgi:hypothetical protein
VILPICPESLTTEADLVEDHRSPIEAGRGILGWSFGGCFRGSLGRSFFDHFTFHDHFAGTASATIARGHNDSTAVAVAAAAAAAVATIEQTTVATTEHTAVATTTEQTAVATRAAVAATTIDVAAAAIAAVATNVAVAASTAGATMATMTGLSRLLTTEQGNADNREEDRDSKNHNTIHPNFLQCNLTGPETEHFTPSACTAHRDDDHSRQTRPSCLHALDRNRLRCPVSKLYGLRDLQHT